MAGTDLTLDTGEASSEKQCEVSRTRVPDAERLVGDVELAVAASRAAQVGLEQDITLTADVAVVALDAAS